MRRLLLILSAALAAWATLVAISGGIQWRIAGVVLRSRDPVRPLVLGTILLLVHAIVFRSAFARDIDRAGAVVRRLLPGLALLCALTLATHALRHGAFTAGGSDSFGYLSQAYAWMNGPLPRPMAIPISAPWPSADASLSPLGYRPGPAPHTMVPTYAPGLPLLMAAAMVFGVCGPFLVVTIGAALATWLTFLLGRRTGGPWTGILAAWFVTTSPIVLYQSIWAMSDIPAAALWTGATLAALGGRRRSALWAGMWTAAGLLVRPNLPVVPAILLAHVALSSAGRERWIRIALFSAAVAPAAIAIAALNTAWYGAPWNSGYGAAAEIFSASNVVPNLARYPAWLWRSQSPLLLLAFVPLLPPFRRDVSGPAVTLCAAIFVATLGSYLVYSPFEEWWYLRFLLPALPGLFVLMCAGLVALGRRLPAPWGVLAVAAASAALAGYTIHFSQAEGVFGPLRDTEARYADVGSYVGEALPADAVVLTVQHSGSVRYYGGRLTVRWDLIDRAWVTRAPGELERLGLHPYLLIEDWELPQMREWFGLAPDAPSAWPLVARQREPVGINLFDLSSRPPTTLVPAALEPAGARRCRAPQPLIVQRP